MLSHLFQQLMSKEKERQKKKKKRRFWSDGWQLAYCNKYITTRYGKMENGRITWLWHVFGESQ
jgi:hypothetical protein